MNLRKFKVILGSVVSSRPDWARVRTYLKISE